MDSGMQRQCRCKKTDGLKPQLTKPTQLLILRILIKKIFKLQRLFFDTTFYNHLLKIWITNLVLHFFPTFYLNKYEVVALVS